MGEWASGIADHTHSMLPRGPSVCCLSVRKVKHRSVLGRFPNSYRDRDRPATHPKTPGQTQTTNPSLQWPWQHLGSLNSCNILPKN